MGFKKKFFKNIAAFGGYSYLTWFLETILSTVILSRFLEPKEYGFVALISIFSGFILLFSNTGLAQSIIRSEYGLTFQRIIFSLSLWIGLVLGLLLCLMAYPITLIYNKPELFWPTIVISIQFVTNSMNIVPMALLQKRLEFKSIGKINLINSTLTVCLMILLAVLGFRYWAIIIPLVIQPMIRHIFLEQKTHFGFHLYGLKLALLGLKKIRTLFQSLSLFNFVNYFARNADNFVVGKFYGVGVLGLYDRAYKFIYMARRLINSTIGPVLFPSLMDAKSKGMDYKIHFLEILGMLNILNFAISAPLVLLAKPISLVLWGQKWVGVAEFMPYIGAIIPLQTLLIACDDLYMIDKKEKSYMTLGIPLSLILVAGIIVGAFFSALHVARFYALSYTLIQIPVGLYFGHYRILNFSSNQIVRFWFPKLLLTNLLIFSIWFGNIYTTSLIMLLLGIDTFYGKQKDIGKILVLVKGGLSKKTVKK
jgi:O-antigen/teichoic acid export membrane protein